MLRRLAEFFPGYVHSSLTATGKAAIYYYYYYYYSVFIIIDKFVRIFHETVVFILQQACSAFV